MIIFRLCDPLDTAIKINGSLDILQLNDFPILYHNFVLNSFTKGVDLSRTTLSPSGWDTSAQSGASPLSA
jgi:hypothetical protein